MKRISTLLFAAFGLLISALAQSPFELDSLQYIQELQEKKIPQLIEVRAEGESTLFFSPTDTTKHFNKIDGMPLFLLGDESRYWACSYLGRTAYVRKSDAVNSEAIQRAYDSASRHYRYLLAYNAVVQGLQIALDYSEQAQKAVADGTLDNEPDLQLYLNSRHRELDDATGYLDKMDPRAFFGK